MNLTADDLAIGRTLFTVFGVPWKSSSKAWLFIPTRLGFSMVIALVFLRSYSIPERVMFGFLYAGLVVLSQCIHILGHTLSSKVVGSPMEANVILDTKILTYYPHDAEDLPRRIHLGRALGGPVLNGITALIGLIAWLLTGSHIWLFFTLLNLALSLGVLLPFPGVDGEVVWHELRRKG
jgi:Zn-dependent protease